MSTALAVDRSRVCTYTFANGCQCRIPLSPSHPYLCTFHACKENQVQSAQRVGQDVAFDLSGRYVSYGDLSSALAHTMTALAQRQVTPRAATSFAYLGQILFQSLDRSESEYIRTFGVDSWKRQVATNFTTPKPADRPDDSANDLAATQFVDDRNAAQDADRNAAYDDPADALDQTPRLPEQAQAENDPEPHSDAPIAPNPSPSKLQPPPEIQPQPEVEAALANLRISLETR